MTEVAEREREPAHPASSGARGVNSPLHASPAVVGKVAQSAGVGRLIVSHLGQFDLNAAVAELKKSYTGPLTIGADLQCTPVQ